MRLPTAILAVGLMILVVANFPGTPPRVGFAGEGVTLLGTLEEWKYPGTKMPQGASASDGGNPAVPSVKLQAILTTTDPFEQVVEFYARKFGVAAAAGADDAAAGAKDAEAKSVLVQDDSVGRAVNLKVFVVQKAETSTTLVISRAKDEKETHIAWSHYRRFSLK